MRTLLQSLQDFDRAHLKAIAEKWGAELPAGDTLSAASHLAQQILRPESVDEMVQALPAQGREALLRLEAEGGQIPWGDFTQRFGELREMGSARRERLKPWREPVSTTEVLYYRGFIARAFAETPLGLKEFAYIPNDLLQVMPRPSSEPEGSLGRVSAPPERTVLANAAIVDDITTLLAALRQQSGAVPGTITPEPSDIAPFLQHPKALDLLRALCLQLGLVSGDGLSPKPEPIGQFLQLERGEALRRLAQAWLTSETWHDFQLLQHLDPGASGWPSPSQPHRQAALGLIGRVPLAAWWDLDSFVQAVHLQFPSYGRPGTSFKEWLLRDKRTGALLGGMKDWESVDGAYLRALLVGPLHWLGVVDLGLHGPAGQPQAFRRTDWATTLFESSEPPLIREPAAAAVVHGNGRIELPRATPRHLRYQVARLSSWLPSGPDIYRYRLRPAALLAAGAQGLRPSHLHRLLEDLSEAPVPPTLSRAIDRLMEHGVEARIERNVIVRVESESILDQLYETPSTRRFLRERLGPKSAIATETAMDELVQAATSLGLLIEAPAAGASGRLQGG